MSPTHKDNYLHAHTQQLLWCYCQHISGEWVLCAVTKSILQGGNHRGRLGPTGGGFTAQFTSSFVVGHIADLLVDSTILLIAVYWRVGQVTLACSFLEDSFVTVGILSLLCSVCFLSVTPRSLSLFVEWTTTHHLLFGSGGAWFGDTLRR
ncbi:hypothetical protein Pelo_4749 [Pelomyxa schiedti]|nr:hypothetical protein Pelo_4749 [Pelomyxa schiedti]